MNMDNVRNFVEDNGTALLVWTFIVAIAAPFAAQTLEFSVWYLYVLIGGYGIFALFTSSMFEPPSLTTVEKATEEGNTIHYEEEEEDEMDAGTLNFDSESDK